MRELLEEYGDIFEIPRALPPQRKVDHEIELVSVHSLINVNMVILRKMKYNDLWEKCWRQGSFDLVEALSLVMCF